MFRSLFNYSRRERVQIWIIVSMVLLLSAFRLLIEIQPQVDSFFAAYTQFPVAISALNILFFWLLGLIWIAYRRWRESIMTEEELERVLMGISPDSLVVVNRNAEIVTCSEQVRAMFGFSESELFGRKTDVLYQDCRADGAKGDMGARLERFGFRVGYAMGKRKDGSTFPLEVVTGAIRFQQGSVILMRDITELSRVEDALRQSEIRFEQFMYHFPGFAFIKDKEGRRVYLNEAYSRERGWDLAASLGRTDEDLYRADLAKQYRETDDLVREKGEIVRYVTRITEPDGKSRSLLTLKFPLPVPERDGTEVMVAGLSLDISEQEAAERERAKIERQMQQAQKLESLGGLAGGIAHDFNNLLMGVVGHADLALAQTQENAGASRHIESMIVACQRAAELANQLLAYSGKGRFQLEVASLAEMVSDLSGLLKVSVSKKAVLFFDLAQAVSCIECDVTQLRQVIMNLIVNASDALENRPGTISVQTGESRIPAGIPDTGAASIYPDPATVPAGNYVFMRVSDTGVGINKEHQQQIFDPFFTTKASGHGLGLAVVQGIVKSHSGMIEIESEPGKGSRITVYFPATDKAVAPKHKHAQLDRHWTGNGSILLADDEDMVRDVAVLMLQNLGFEPVAVADGRSAVAVVEQQADKLSAVILDMTMPELDGAQVYRMIREKSPSIPVILSSGYNQQEEDEDFRGDRNVYFLKKPYRLDALRSMLRDISESSTRAEANG